MVALARFSVIVLPVREPLGKVTDQSEDKRDKNNFSGRIEGIGDHANDSH
jgi:hypothetical protein